MRVRKARKQSHCGYCGALIVQHQLIALLDAGYWVHADQRWPWNCLHRYRAKRAAA